MRGQAGYGDLKGINMLLVGLLTCESFCSAVVIQTCGTLCW